VKKWIKVLKSEIKAKKWSKVLNSNLQSIPNLFEPKNVFLGPKTQLFVTEGVFMAVLALLLRFSTNSCFFTLIKVLWIKISLSLCLCSKFLCSRCVFYYTDGEKNQKNYFFWLDFSLFSPKKWKIFGFAPSGPRKIGVPSAKKREIRSFVCPAAPPSSGCVTYGAPYPAGLLVALPRCRCRRLPVCNHAA